MVNNPYLPGPAKILEIKKETAIDYTFTLKTDLTFEYGQFVEVSLPGVGEGPLSISDFGPGWFKLTIRRVGKLTNYLHTLKPGDSLFIRGPYGNGFSPSNYKDKPLIIAAGGTGLAPVRGLINFYYRQPEEIKDLTLLLGFKSPQDILFQEDLTLWQEKFPLTLTVDQGQQDWPGHVGLITSFVKEAVAASLSDSQVIIVGPPLMMKFTSQEFLSHGVPVENIWVSFERKMCCGIGKCGHCKIDDTYVCLEGPVFPLTKALKLID